MMRASVCIAGAMIAAASVQAQPPVGPPGGGPPRGFPPGFHLMTALDADKDRKISAKEIEGAVLALQKLDKNQDGKLSSEEIGWPPSFGGGRGRGGFPGFGGQPRGRPRRPDPDAADSSPPREQRPADRPTNRRRRFFSAKQLRSMDANDDGKITEDEMPQRMRPAILGRVDTNKDGLLDKDELAKHAASEAGRE